MEITLTYEIYEYVRNSSNESVWCRLFDYRVVDPFFFLWRTIAVIIYLDTIVQIVFPQLEQIEQRTQQRVIQMQDGTLPLSSRCTQQTQQHVSRWLDWQRCQSFPWPSQKSRPYYFGYLFCWKYIKSTVYVEKICHLVRNRICESAFLTLNITTVNPHFDSTDAIDVSRATNGCRIETYYDKEKRLFVSFPVHCQCKNH